MSPHQLRFAALFLLPAAIVSGQQFDPLTIFGGPSVLGRAYGAGAARRSTLVAFRPFVSLRAIFDDSYTSTNLDENGEPITRDLSGYLISGGVYGQKTWRRSQLSMGLLGGYRNYTTRFNTSNGWNARALLGYSHQVGKRALFRSTNVFGTIDRSFGYGLGFNSPLQELDPAFESDPDDEIYDSRVTFFSNSNSLSYTFSPRWSGSMNGGVFANKRTRGLISARGTNASGDIAYRVTRRQTISVSYGYNQFNFSDRYGNSFMQLMGVGYAWEMGDGWVVNLRALGYRLENEGLQRVTISPEIAAIIGQGTGLETFYRLNYFPGFMGSLSKSFRTMTAGVTAANTVRPGNGIYLTSRTTRLSGYYSYTGIRHWNFHARMGTFRRANLLRFSGNIRNIYGGAGVGYQLGPGLQLSANAIYRTLSSTTPDNDFVRRGWRYTFGISYSPGDIPLALF